MKFTDLHSPSPIRPTKRSFLDAFDPLAGPASGTAPKRQRPELHVLNWLNTIPPVRTRSAPINSNKIDFTIPSGEFLTETRPFSNFDDMDHLQSKDEKDTSSQTTGKSNITTIKPSSSKYRSVLEYNHVEIDSTGLKMSPGIQELVQANILKGRSSPPLSQDLLNNTVTSMNLLGSSTGNVVNNFMSSAMFPVARSNLGHGGNSIWPRAALPFDPDYGYGISTPKPDYHVGYAIGKKSGFTAQEAHVLDHTRAQNYTQPGTGSILPFITVEMKSEATGGTLFHAENQAAGSGTYSVRAMEWLLDQAKAESTAVDSVSFSIAATGRLVVLSIHWFSPEEKIYYMSYVKSFNTTDTEHVQACHNTVKNIVDWAVGDRHDKLKKTLQTLFPLSKQWSKRSSMAAQLDGEDDKVDEIEDNEVQSQRSGKSRLSQRSRIQSNSRTSSQTRLIRMNMIDLYIRIKIVAYNAVEVATVYNIDSIVAFWHFLGVQILLNSF